MSDYMTAQELADMIGCQANSYACMKRWLKKRDWPYETSIRGFPKVSRAYHAARMAGKTPEQAAEALTIEPDFSMFPA